MIIHWYIIDWYMLQWHSLSPLHIACICQEVNQKCVATPEFVTFGVEMYSSHPRPWPHSSIGVNSSSDD